MPQRMRNDVTFESDFIDQSLEGFGLHALDRPPQPFDGVVASKPFPAPEMRQKAERDVDGWSSFARLSGVLRPPIV